MSYLGEKRRSIKKPRKSCPDRVKRHPIPMSRGSRAATPKSKIVWVRNNNLSKKQLSEQETRTAAHFWVHFWVIVLKWVVILSCSISSPFLSYWLDLFDCCYFSLFDFDLINFLLIWLSTSDVKRSFSHGCPGGSLMIWHALGKGPANLHLSKLFIFPDFWSKKQILVTTMSTISMCQNP